MTMNWARGKKVKGSKLQKVCQCLRRKSAPLQTRTNSTVAASYNRILNSKFQR